MNKKEANILFNEGEKLEKYAEQVSKYAEAFRVLHIYIVHDEMQDLADKILRTSRDIIDLGKGRHIGNDEDD